MGEDGIAALACGDVQHMRLQHCVMISRGDTVRGITIRLGAAIGDSRCKSIIESEFMSSFFLPEIGIGIFIAECLAECCCFVHGRQLSTFLWLILSCFLWPIEIVLNVRIDPCSVSTNCIVCSMVGRCRSRGGHWRRGTLFLGIWIENGFRFRR